MVPGDHRGVHAGLLAIDSQQDGETLTIALNGELDLANAPALESELDRAFAGDDARVVIDLSGLVFIDSTGIALLIASIGNGGERLRFVPSQAPAVTRVLEITGVDRRLPLVEGAATDVAEPA